MPIVITCQCGKQFSVPESRLGKRFKCHLCGHELLVPESLAPTVPAPKNLPEASVRKSLEYLEYAIEAIAMRSPEERKVVENLASKRRMGYSDPGQHILEMGIKNATPEQKQEWRALLPPLTMCGYEQLAQRAQAILDLIDGGRNAERAAPSLHKVIVEMENWSPDAQQARLGELIKMGVGVNEVDEKGNTPLHIAVRYRQGATIDYLISRGANINTVNAKGESPLDCLYGNSYSVNKFRDSLVLNDGAKTGEYLRAKKSLPTTEIAKKWWQFWK